MTVSFKLWRIAAETKEYSETDLSGKGAAKFPGRWNALGEHVIYAAPTLSLAVLETVAHVDDAGLPLNKFVVRLSAPIDVWKKRQVIDANDLDPAWCAIPSGKASEDAGSKWYQASKAALLMAPSVIVPEESVAILNASHPDIKKIKAKTIRIFEYNKLFRT